MFHNVLIKLVNLILNKNNIYIYTFGKLKHRFYI
uniref:Uncharacterized protein n=1 Tax=viral metagenome TaxID=1070528 RepID=A0A6C0CB34_9ZZZZ